MQQTTTQTGGGMQTPANMTEQDWATDVLILEKHLSVAYSTALNEASTQPLFDLISTICRETQTQQHKLYELMKQQGWYNPTPETPQALQKTAQKASADLTKLPVH
ncbi:spore coat protein [Jeotgalibacillus sp. ET6]|uniref:spore coat protein n=1 Tax=Jeotgalibacillus sp. ET6 TaxID=3037260 RepID=UPI0024189598|nr:spore coat protein [Jeotgalibacillus sp. ET6]MDG5471730.1 spore coat protein [Jeotgalibacillus sp. ET6]